MTSKIFGLSLHSLPNQLKGMTLPTSHSLCFFLNLAITERVTLSQKSLMYSSWNLTPQDQHQMNSTSSMIYLQMKQVLLIFLCGHCIQMSSYCYMVSELNKFAFGR